ncbi:MAG: hypothetical protein OEN23_08585 [Paracoccaceae bacterium]|nr:hypothetical protein [Paracoccaceae bacterium]
MTVAALGVSVPDVNLSEGREAAICESVLAAATAVTLKLGAG